MSPRVRAVCIHGHYYQPPREHPWLGVVEPEPSAAPDPNWNVRILREAYAANAAARLLDDRGRLRDVVDNYRWTSFNVGPTLDAWLEVAAPELLAGIVRADRDSLVRTGHGNAWAQAYNHPILPLCTPRDVRTQVRWGARAFELRFGRPPEGMWLPEMAVDVPTLEAVAAEGIGLTMLSPHQAARVRPVDGDWSEVRPEGLDVRRLYRCPLPSGRSIDIVFREPEGSQGMAFGELLRDGGVLASRMRGILGDAEGDAALVTVATDGETFGHHHRFGEMAVAFAVESWRRAGDVAVLNPAAFRDVAPPTYEVEIVERSSWSCVHGIERWRDDCGCRTGGPVEWTQAWRRPLREAVDWLQDVLATWFEEGGGAAVTDPWSARERWVDAVVAPARGDRTLAEVLRPGATAADRVRARQALEMARHALLMQTSCGWFFEDVAGVEATLVLRQAGRAIDLARALGARLEDEFLDRLVPARSNVDGEGTAADVYRRHVNGRAVTPQRIAATAILLDRIGESPTLPGYRMTIGGGDGAVPVTVVEERTGARSEILVDAAPHGAQPSCAVEDRRYGVGDLFRIQRGRLLERLATSAVQAVRQARHDALAHLRGVIDPLIARDPELPVELAMLLGYEEAERLAEAVRSGDRPIAELGRTVIELRARGVSVSLRTLATLVGERLVGATCRLPEGIAEAIATLDFADATDTPLDLAPAQIALVRWWTEAHPAAPSAELVALRDRLGVSPEIGLI